MVFSMRKALVTGGAGFVGHGVVRALQARGVAVVVLDPAPPHPLWHPGVTHLQGNLLDSSALGNAARGVDAVFHIAGLWDGALVERIGCDTSM